MRQLDVLHKDNRTCVVDDVVDDEGWPIPPVQCQLQLVIAVLWVAPLPGINLEVAFQLPQGRNVPIPQTRSTGLFTPLA